ncbi:MAG: hypothetical protein ACR2H3_02095 [Acidimicrobiales bacterium]
MANDPSPELELTPLDGKPRTVRMWLTTFHLSMVVVDPYTNESSWVLPTACRVLQNFEETDCRVAFVVTAEADDAKRFLGPWAKEILTFVDPDRKVVAGFGLERLPAILHVDMGGQLVSSAEGWDPDAWQNVTDGLAAVTSWTGPVLPGTKDPGPFAGSPAAG